MSPTLSFPGMKFYQFQLKTRGKYLVRTAAAPVGGADGGLPVRTKDPEERRSSIYPPGVSVSVCATGSSGNDAGGGCGAATVEAKFVMAIESGMAEGGRSSTSR